MAIVDPDSSRSPIEPSMLLSFRGENVRSFREPFEISLIATPLAEEGVVRTVRWRDGEGQRSHIGVLPAAAIFGANASGKSNVLRAMSDMRDTVLQSFRGWSPDGGTRRRPYKLDRAAILQPSTFEIELVLDGVRHVYGFSLDDEQIVSEWAYRYPHGRQQLMFERQLQEYKLGQSFSSSLATATEVVRPNALLLSTAAALRGNELRDLYAWFRRNLLLAGADSRAFRQVYTAKLLDDAQRRQQVLALLTAADLGIVDVREDHIDPELQDKLEQVVRILNDADDVDTEIEEGVLGKVFQLVHRGSDGDVRFDFDEESLGTQVWLGLVGPIVEALADGSVLLADELDASLHPDLVAQVVGLFQNPESNPRRAQLVFNSHDATILGDSGTTRPIGRDQVWFTERSSDFSSRLFPLSDLNPRKNEAVGRRYLDGRYGATPVVSRAGFAAAADLVSPGPEA